MPCPLTGNNEEATTEKMLKRVHKQIERWWLLNYKYLQSSTSTLTILLASFQQSAP